MYDTEGEVEMQREEREQKIARLRIDYQNLLLDVGFDDERIEHTFGPAQDYYKNQKRLNMVKLDKVRKELERLGGTH